MSKLSESKMKVHEEQLSWNYENISKCFPNQAVKDDGDGANKVKDTWKMTPQRLLKQFKANSVQDDSKYDYSISTNLYVVDGQFKGYFWFKEIEKGKKDQELKKYELTIMARIVDQNETTLASSDGVPRKWENKYCWVFKFETKLEDMWKQKEKYFTNDTLRLRYDLLFVNNQLPDFEFLPKTITTLSTDLGELLKSGDESDISFVCGPSPKYQLHKCILAVRCPTFIPLFESKEITTQVTQDENSTSDSSSSSNNNNDAAISTNNDNPVIKIEDVKPQIFELIIKYIYTSKVDVDKMDFKTLEQLFDGGDKYKLDELKKICLDQMLRNINEETCVKVAIHAFVFEVDKCIREFIYHYCKSKWKNLIKNPNSKKLIQRFPAAFLQPFDEEDETKNGEKETK